MNASQRDPTQTDRLLFAREAAHGGWVGLPELVHRTGAYAVHSRAADLRRRGLPVENRVRFDPLTGRRHSFYRLA